MKKILACFWVMNEFRDFDINSTGKEYDSPIEWCESTNKTAPKGVNYYFIS